MTQALKRAPWNARRLLRVPKTQNPKALALFVRSALTLSRCGLIGDNDLVPALIKKLEELRSPSPSEWCWGYSFPWQTRTVVVPRGAANLVCTVFVANALLDVYENSGNARLLEMATSSCDYILRDLYWIDGNDVASLAYPLPTSRARVHNANLLGAALLTRVARLSGSQQYIEPALKVARYSAGAQQPDGSWHYGDMATQRWVDNFHTGYNLEALRSIGENVATTEFDARIRSGLGFFREHFIRKDGAPRYFHDRTFPIDIHCVSQSIITLAEFRYLDEGSLDEAYRVFVWAKNHMLDPEGFFYYRVLRLGRIKTSYMRWSQAWMLIALSTLLDSLRKD